jgi:hypothetical protein
VSESEPDYFKDGSHIFLGAPTGSRTDYGGKTTIATWWCATHGRVAFDLCLFVNVKLDDGPEKHADVVCQNLHEVAAAINDGADFVTLSPPTEDWEGVSRRVKQFVQKLPKDWDKLVVLDELPELDEDAVLWFVRVAGNGNNVKTIGLAQNPGDVSTSARGQMILAWVGPATGNNKAVFEANDRGAHKTHLQNQEPYHWSVLLGPDASDRDEWNPVPEKYVA